MEISKWGALAGAGLLLVSYNLAQPGINKLRNNRPDDKVSTAKTEAYGPSLQWLDRLARASDAGGTTVGPDGKLQGSGAVKLDFSVMSSLMVAGLASGFKSQVANLLWMKSDEYWHEGLFTRQVPLMEAVVTLDPQFIDAWSTAGWHWAYNIYADIPTNPDYEKKGPEAIRVAQDNAVKTGLDYLDRGSNLNPDTYRLWFEYGWTRAEKAGFYDQKTVELYKTARSKSDAREIEVSGAGGQMIKEKGLDILGRTIGHLWERVPEFDKAQSQYADDLMGATPRQRQLLDKAGDAWHRYGGDYTAIVDVYQSGDAVTKSQVKALVPDIDQIIAGQDTRQKIAGQTGKDQPVGAYITIAARYMPAWRMMKAGDLDGAIQQITGVMNADEKYHLIDLPVLKKIYEIRGDSPAAIDAALKQSRENEKNSSQDLGLHFLARLWEMKLEKATDPAQKLKLAKQAYRTWYRSRARDALDFYALRKTRVYEDKYKFTTPEDIVNEIKNSRKGGVPNAAPKVAPNVQNYY